MRANNLVLCEIASQQSPIADRSWLWNPDAEVQPGATAGRVAVLESDPKVGTVGLKLL